MLLFSALRLAPPALRGSRLLAHADKPNGRMLLYYIFIVVQVFA